MTTMYNALGNEINKRGGWVATLTGQELLLAQRKGSNADLPHVTNDLITTLSEITDVVKKNSVRIDAARKANAADLKVDLDNLLKQYDTLQAALIDQRNSLTTKCTNARDTYRSGYHTEYWKYKSVENNLVTGCNKTNIAKVASQIIVDVRDDTWNQDNHLVLNPLAADMDLTKITKFCSLGGAAIQLFRGWLHLQLPEFKEKAKTLTTAFEANREEWQGSQGYIKTIDINATVEGHLAPVFGKDSCSTHVGGKIWSRIFEANGVHQGPGTGFCPGVGGLYFCMEDIAEAREFFFVLSPMDKLLNTGVTPPAYEAWTGQPESLEWLTGNSSSVHLSGKEILYIPAGYQVNCVCHATPNGKRNWVPPLVILSHIPLTCGIGNLNINVKKAISKWNCDLCDSKAGKMWRERKEFLESLLTCAE